MKPIDNVGIIGLGRMGLPMAGHLLAADFAVHGYDTDPAAMQDAQSAGVVTMNSAARTAAQSDAVILIVGFDSQVEQAVFGDEGVTAGARPGTILMVASTVAPGYMKTLARRVADLDLTAIDIPVARGEMAARSGELLVFAGGDRDAVEQCRPFDGDLFGPRCISRRGRRGTDRQGDQQHAALDLSRRQCRGAGPG